MATIIFYNSDSVLMILGDEFITHFNFLFVMPPIQFLMISQEEDQMSIELEKDSDSLHDNQQQQQLCSQHIKGEVDSFISHGEMSSREPDTYQVSSPEHQEWEPIARHYRSKEHTEKNTRKPKVLKQCLNFILNHFGGLLAKNLSDREQRIRILQFIHNRIMAIRCQYYVQEIFDIEDMEKIIKSLLLVESLMEKPIRIVGIDQFTDPKNKVRFLSCESYKKSYVEILRIAIYSSNKCEFLNILSDHHDQIQQNQELISAVKRQKNILNNNYQVYFRTLASSKTDVFSKLVLWSKIDRVRKVYVERMIAANMNQQMALVCKILGLKKKQGWINLRKERDENNKNIEELRKHFDMGIKIWIPLSEIVKACQSL